MTKRIWKCPNCKKTVSTCFGDKALEERVERHKTSCAKQAYDRVMGR